MRQSCSVSTSFCNADVAALPLGCDTQRGYRSSARTLCARSYMTERGHAHMHEKGRVVGWGAPRSPCGRRHQSDGQDLRTVCLRNGERSHVELEELQPLGCRRAVVARRGRQRAMLRVGRVIVTPSGARRGHRAP